VNTLFLLADTMGVEPRKRLLVDLDNLVDDAVPGVRGGGGVTLGAESRAPARALLPLDETYTIMQAMDEVRRQIGLS